jgi:hypothetical protein
MPVLATTSLMMSSLITRGSRIRGQDVPQVIDARGDNRDCQREHPLRKLPEFFSRAKNTLIGFQSRA